MQVVVRVYEMTSRPSDGSRLLCDTVVNGGRLLP